MLRCRIPTTATRLLFFLSLIILFNLSQPLTAQGNEGEAPFPDPVPPALPILELAAAPLTITTFPAPTTPLTVTLTNHGTGAAQGVTLQLDGGLLTLPISQTIGTIEMGQTITTTLPLELQGYTSGAHSLLLTSDAISLTNPIQTHANLTFLEPEPTNFGPTGENLTETDDSAKDTPPSGPTLQLLQAQRPPHDTWRGRILTFALTNSQGTEKELTLNLSTWLPGIELNPTALQLSYQATTQAESAAESPTLFEFHYDNSTMNLTFSPRGDGYYTLASSHNGSGESMSSSVPDDPQGWVPTFNAPTVALFQGSVSYQYPILTPPGPGLFQPSLALAYNGSASHGLAGRSQSDMAGFGWDLTGSIEVSQAVTICPWNGGEHSVCPVNAYWEDGAQPGLIELTLSLGGTGYELTHINGSAQNGYPGRYTLKGNTNLYVEYCRYSNSDLCEDADTDDSTVDGAATATQTQGYWVIKDSQNTLYRLGYTTDAEQEFINGIESGSQMGPWAGGNAAGHALRWRVDQVKDRFSNETDYDYYEFLPSQNNTTWSNNQVHAKASYPHTITYGHNQIVFHYDRRGDDMGIPPNSWYVYPDVISWQTHLLEEIEVTARDYETGSGDYNLVRSYIFTQLAQRHGHNVDQMPEISNQSAVCTDHYTAYWNWKLGTLVSITELDANGQARVRVNNQNKPDVEFKYWWYKTGYYDDNNNYATYCAPYLTHLHTPYTHNPNTIPVVTFSYYENAFPYYSNNAPDYTSGWVNPVVSQTLNGGWTTDAPPQVTSFGYAYPHHGAKARHEAWGYLAGAFQGFQEVTRIIMNGGTPHLKEVNHFLAYNFNDHRTSLTGSMDWQEVRTADDKIMTRSEEDWQAVAITVNGYSTYLPRRLSTIHYTTYYPSTTPYYDPADNLGTRTDYSYDEYNNVVQVREYGTDVAAASVPYRVQETLYAHNTSPSNWLIGLPWRVTVWDGEPNPSDPGKIISRQRTRYDGATCAQVNAQTPTNGLVTASDVYIPGGGSNHCDLNYLTTIMNYGQNGDLWWQPAQTAVPTGVGVFPNVQYNVQTIHWRNHTTIEKIVTTSLGETLYDFNDSHTPWLFTDKTAPNGAKTRYEYDTFGRLIKQYTPNPSSGQATILSQQITYKDSEPIVNGVPLTIDIETVPGQPYNSNSRTFYDALGRVRQQRSWNLSSDIWGTNNSTRVVTDTEYNNLGQVSCQTTPIFTPWAVFNETLACTTYDHTTTSYTRTGSPASTTGIDGLTSYVANLGLTSFSINPAGHFSAQNQDAYGRLASVAEYNIQHNAFATTSGAFNTDPAQWQLQNATATTLGSEQVLQMNGTAWGPYNLLRSSYSLDPTTQEGVSVFFRFRLSSNNHQGRMGLLTNQGGFIGLSFYQGYLFPDYNMNQGDQSHMGVRIAQQSSVWYRAQMSVGSSGVVSWRVWQENAPGDPDKQFTWKLDTTASKTFYSTATYKFFSHVGGTVYLGGYQEGPAYVTQYSYDKANNLLTVTDTVGNTTSLTYDKLGRKLTMSDPDMGNWSYAYDLAGNLIRQTDAKYQRLCFTYDNLNRLLTKKDDGLYSSTLSISGGITHRIYQTIENRGGN